LKDRDNEVVRSFIAKAITSLFDLGDYVLDPATIAESHTSLAPRLLGKESPIAAALEISALQRNETAESPQDAISLVFTPFVLGTLTGSQDSKLGFRLSKTRPSP
jgi:hypothetical protein